MKIGALHPEAEVSREQQHRDRERACGGEQEREPCQSGSFGAADLSAFSP